MIKGYWVLWEVQEVWDKLRSTQTKKHDPERPRCKSPWSHVVPFCGLYLGSYEVKPKGTTKEPMGRDELELGDPVSP